MACMIFGMCLGHIIGRVHAFGPDEALTDRTVFIALLGCITFGPLAVREFLS